MSETPCYVYLIAAYPPEGVVTVAPEGCDLIKVGITESIPSRLSTIKTACPFEPSIVSKWKMHNKKAARAVERQFHANTQMKRLNGEWFVYGVVPAMVDIDFIILEYADKTLKLYPRAIIDYLATVGIDNKAAVDLFIAENGRDCSPFLDEYEVLVA